MTLPSFLATGFAFQSVAGVTDVQTIMDDMVTMLTSTLSSTPTGTYPSGERWSKTGAGPYVFTAPSDNGGRFMKLTLGRTSITRLQFQFEDPSGVLTNGEIDIAAGGSQVNMFGGPGHVYIEANNAGTWEVASCSLTDPTPEPLASSTTYVFGRVWRNSAGSTVSGGDIRTWLGRYTGGTVYGTTFYTNGVRPLLPALASSATKLRTVAGSDVVAPVYMGNDVSNFGGVWTQCGKMYQFLWVDGNQLPGAILNVPVDVGITAQFQVSHLGSQESVALAIRMG